MGNIKATVAPRKNIVVTNYTAGASGGGLGLNNGGFTTENILPNQVLDTFAVDAVRFAKYAIQGTYNNEVHVLELNLTHDGTDTYISVYGEILSDPVQPLFSFDADIDTNTSEVRLLVDPLFAGTVIKFSRIEVLV